MILLMLVVTPMVRAGNGMLRHRCHHHHHHLSSHQIACTYAGLGTGPRLPNSVSTSGQLRQVSIIIPILQTRRLRLAENPLLAQGHTATQRAWI